MKNILLYILLPLAVILPPSLISNIKLHALAVLIPAIGLPVIVLIHDMIASAQKFFHKYVILLLFGYLWGIHCLIGRQLY